MDWKISITSFFLVVACACTIPFMQDMDKFECGTTTQTNVVQVVDVQTNAIDNAASTNATERGNQNLNWFKDNSNYIWDGWKIK